MTHITITRGALTSSVPALGFPGGNYHVTSRAWTRATMGRSDALPTVTGPNGESLAWSWAPTGGVRLEPK